MAVALALSVAACAAWPRVLSRGFRQLESRLLLPETDVWRNLPQTGEVHVSFQDVLLIAGSTGISCLRLDGRTVWQRDVPLEEPHAAAAGRSAVVWTRAGTLLLADRAGCRETAVSSGIDWAVPREDGGALILTAGSGYLGELLTLDRNGAILERRGETDRVPLWSDGRGNDCYGNLNGQWSLQTEEGEALFPAPILGMCPLKGGFGLWTGEQICLYDTAGTRQVRDPLGGARVTAWSGDEVLALALQREGRWILEILDFQGAIRRTELPGKPREIAVCGDFVCVLDSAGLRVYDYHGKMAEYLPEFAWADGMIRSDLGLILLMDGKFLVHRLP